MYIINGTFVWSPLGLSWRKDEDLNSRKIVVYGQDTMRQLLSSNVLVYGLGGFGVEVGMYV